MNELVYFGERPRLGEILVGGGKLEQKQLDRALSHQDSVSTRIGEILVTLGYISEDDLTAALAEHLQMAVYVPDPGDEFVKVEVSPAFHHAHPFALIQRGEQGKVILLVGDPLDGDLLAALPALFPGAYEIHLLAEPTLRAIMAEHYGLDRQHSTVDGVLVDESDVDRLKDMASEAPVI